MVSAKGEGLWPEREALPPQNSLFFFVDLIAIRLTGEKKKEIRD
ncbi:MAG: hypothetical protein ACJAZ9_000750 [Neolewinella sp.]|jgi:hypothetical protein